VGGHGTAEISEEEWDHTFQAGFKGTLYSMKAVLLKFEESAWGRIINFGSPIALSGKAHTWLPTIQLKGAIRSPTLTTAHEMGNLWNHHQLRPSGFFNDALANIRKDANQPENFLWRLPTGYLGDPEHYAGGLVAFLASDDASDFTGGTLILNGEAAH
jgi:NAD(P)-dependent dehydrogenase (short-subunit alcohol dehydrogenase family)